MRMQNDKQMARRQLTNGGRSDTENRNTIKKGFERSNSSQSSSSSSNKTNNNNTCAPHHLNSMSQEISSMDETMNDTNHNQQPPLTSCDNVYSSAHSINGNSKSKCRTGWPQHVWALELKYSEQ